MSGVVLGDIGRKNGINGIDNGFVLFKNYRVPYDSLLDSLSHINPEGKFRSSIKNNEKRFGNMLIGLMGGRLCVTGSSACHMHMSLCIAIRFSAIRK